MDYRTTGILSEKERYGIVADEGDLARIAADQHLQVSMINRKYRSRLGEISNIYSNIENLALWARSEFRGFAI